MGVLALQVESLVPALPISAYLSPKKESPQTSTPQMPATIAVNAAVLGAKSSSPTKVPSKSWILGDTLDVRMKHHESIKALWESKWRFPCSISVYPFHDGDIRDFEPVFKNLIEKNINDAYSDAYTEAFFPAAEALIEEARAESANGQHAKASSLYLRVAALYRISRFPIINSPVKWRAFEEQKSAYMKAAGNWIEPIREVRIPHTARLEVDGEIIPVYVRVPSSASREKPVPTILLMTGLDGYLPDNTQRTHEFLNRGWATVIAEIPGTAACPACPSDAKSPDRLWDSVLAWMERQGHFDMSKVAVWGLSTGGYYAVRIGHTHSAKLIGSVAQGAGVHHFFGREWLDQVDNHEYPFALTPALAQKFGYSSVEELKAKSQQSFSLVETGILNMPSTRLLLINGTMDGLMPIEDSTLLLEYGSPKEARYFPNTLHMGYPTSNATIYPWLERLLR